MSFVNVITIGLKVYFYPFLINIERFDNYIFFKWWPKHTGFASSIMMFGLGTGGVLFNQIETFYINPKNYSPDKPYSEKFPDEKFIHILKYI